MKPAKRVVRVAFCVVAVIVTAFAWAGVSLKDLLAMMSHLH
jgi:hypothetical protein